MNVHEEIKNKHVIYLVYPKQNIGNHDFSRLQKLATSCTLLVSGVAQEFKKEGVKYFLIRAILVNPNFAQTFYLNGAISQ